MGLLGVFIALMLQTVFVYAEDPRLATPSQMVGAEVVDKVGANVPLDVMMTNHLGQLVPVLSSEDKIPTIVVLNYFECPMLCSLVLNGLIDALKQVNYKLGRDYKVAAVSISPKDTVEVANLKRANYLKELGQPDDSNAFAFYVGSGEQSKRLADAVGFGFRYDEKTGDYAHAAAVFFVSPKGVLTRTLWGVQFRPLDIKMGLVEASAGKIGTSLERVLLTCFHYVPDSRQYGFYVFGAMRLGGAITVAVLGILLLWYFRLERKRIKVGGYL